MPEPDHYIGRFAPSPTGSLHFGSLVAALGSYLQARSKKGRWLLRIEDLDTQREIPGAATQIISSLEQLGFEWDEPLVYQSQSQKYYANALNSLGQRALTYRCNCSRKQLQERAERGQFGLIYPTTCRNKMNNEMHSHALRIITHNQNIAFQDTLLGRYQQKLESEVGDFVILRADGFIAYQLAVVVDDARQGITEIVRGADLLDNTPRQIHLQQLLGYKTPRYAHLPIATNQDKQKLSKQSGAQAITLKNPIPLLLQGLAFLNQKLPASNDIENLNDFWLWATNHWDISRVPTQNIIAPRLFY